MKTVDKMKPTTKLKLENVIRRLVKEEDFFTKTEKLWPSNIATTFNKMDRKYKQEIADSLGVSLNYITTSDFHDFDPQTKSEIFRFMKSKKLFEKVIREEDFHNNISDRFHAAVGKRSKEVAIRKIRNLSKKK